MRVRARFAGAARHPPRPSASFTQSAISHTWRRSSRDRHALVDRGPRRPPPEAGLCSGPRRAKMASMVSREDLAALADCAAVDCDDLFQSGGATLRRARGVVPRAPPSSSCRDRGRAEEGAPPGQVTPTGASTTTPRSRTSSRRPRSSSPAHDRYEGSCRRDRSRAPPALPGDDSEDPGSVERGSGVASSRGRYAARPATPRVASSRRPPRHRARRAASA